MSGASCALCLRPGIALTGDVNGYCADCAADQDFVPTPPGLFHKPKRCGWDWSRTVCELPLKGEDRTEFTGERDRKTGVRKTRRVETILLPAGDTAALNYHDRHGHKPCPVCFRTEVP